MMVGSTHGCREDTGGMEDVFLVILVLLLRLLHGVLVVRRR